MFAHPRLVVAGRADEWRHEDAGDLVRVGVTDALHYGLGPSGRGVHSGAQLAGTLDFALPAVGGVDGGQLPARDEAFADESLH